MKIKRYVLLCRLVCFLVAAFSVLAQEDRKLAKLFQRVKEHGAVIPLTRNDFENFIFGNNRAYDFVVFFEEKSDKQCQACVESRNNFYNVAALYHAQGVMSSSWEKKRVFFGVADWKELSLFKNINDTQRLGYEWVYIHSVLQFPTHRPSKANVPFPLNFRWFISSYTGLKDAKAFGLLWTNHQSGISYISYKKASRSRVSMAIAIAFLAVVAMGIFVSLVYIIRRLPALMAVMALLIQILTCGAFCYCLINKMPWIGASTSPTGIWFHRQGRSQYILEGLMMSSLTVMGGLLFYLTAYLINRKPYKGKPFISFLTLMLAYGCYALLKATHKRKSNFPHVPFFPPPDYAKGPLLADRGNNF